MSNLNYDEATLRSSEKYTSKILNDIQKGMPDSGLRLLKLIEIIPNWETYLTVKQLESAERYIKCLSATEVDYQLNLNIGTTQQRLFGSSTSKGALGKLEETVKILEKQGYFEKQKKLTEKNENKKVKRTSNLTNKTKEQIKELIKLVIEFPDYEQHLTDSQKERMYQFLRLRSIKACAKYFNITETTFKQSLLGKSNKGGILGKLREINNSKTVNNWEDI